MSGSTEWRTPPEFFANLHAGFGFNADAAATPENALVRPDACAFSDKPLAREDHCCPCGRPVGRYYTAETDGTNREHYGPSDRVFCNPPYSPSALLYRFVETAALTAREHGALWVMLLNASCTDTRWFHRFIWDTELSRPRDRVELRLLPGRLRFLNEQGEPGPAPRYANMLAIFRPPLPGSRG